MHIECRDGDGSDGGAHAPQSECSTHAAEPVACRNKPHAAAAAVVLVDVAVRIIPSAAQRAVNTTIAITVNECVCKRACVCAFLKKIFWSTHIFFASVSDVR